VLDNGGGGIFAFLPAAQHQDVFERLFLTPIQLEFERVAALYGLAYSRVEQPGDLEAALSSAFRARPALVHVRFSYEDSVMGHRTAWREVERRLAAAG
jgi:2-succinyl-5-enolpyruvyl-6-hydroxy-3-cyclohexene-1-carboxylate synthase